jgi:hypothetical protein
MGSGAVMAPPRKKCIVDKIRQHVAWAVNDRAMCWLE